MSAQHLPFLLTLDQLVLVLHCDEPGPTERTLSTLRIGYGIASAKWRLSEGSANRK
jgi:hypothetical protein